MKRIIIIIMFVCFKSYCMDSDINISSGDCSESEHQEGIITPDSPIPAKRFFKTPWYSDHSDTSDEKKRDNIKRLPVSQNSHASAESDEESASSPHQHNEYQTINKLLYKTLHINPNTITRRQQEFLIMNVQKLKINNKNDYILLRDLSSQWATDKNIFQNISTSELERIAHSLLITSINDSQQDSHISFNKERFLRNFSLVALSCELIVLCAAFASGLSTFLTQC